MNSSRNTPKPKYNPSSRKRKKLQDTRHDSYRRSLVWRWLNEGVKAGQDPVGQIVATIRPRIDMPTSFATKKQMRTYLEKCGLGRAAIETVFDRLWLLWYEWREFKKHDIGILS